MLAAALCRRAGRVLVSFVGCGKNERMLKGRRHPNDIRREQELENVLMYYHSHMRPLKTRLLISAVRGVFGAFESVH